MSVKYRAMMMMIVLAIVFVVLHLWTGWYAFVNEASSHGEKALWGEYIIQWARDTFENLQSEFWQLAVQFALLAGLFKVINVQAYEEDVEELRKQLLEASQKIDLLLERSESGR